MTIAREGGIEAVLNSIRRFPEDRVVHENALGSLRNIAVNTGMSCVAHDAFKRTVSFVAACFLMSVLLVMDHI